MMVVKIRKKIKKIVNRQLFTKRKFYWPTKNCKKQNISGNLQKNEIRWVLYMEKQQKKINHNRQMKKEMNRPQSRKE